MSAAEEAAWSKEELELYKEWVKRAMLIDEARAMLDAAAGDAADIEAAEKAACAKWGDEATGLLAAARADDYGDDSDSDSDSDSDGHLEAGPLATKFLSSVTALRLPHAHEARHVNASALVASEIAYGIKEKPVELKGHRAADPEVRRDCAAQVAMAFSRVRDVCAEASVGKKPGDGGTFSLEAVVSNAETITAQGNTVLRTDYPLGVAPTVILRHVDLCGTVRLFVASRGSETREDWLRNAAIATEEHKDTDGGALPEFHGAGVHMGFFEAFAAQQREQEPPEYNGKVKGIIRMSLKVRSVQHVDHRILATLETALEAAVKRIRDGGSQPVEVVFCGHSLGAAVALLNAAHANRHGGGVLNKLGLKSRAVTFACPRVGDAQFNAVLSDLVPDHLRVFHENDPVPEIPCAAVSPACEPYLPPAAKHHICVSGFSGTRPVGPNEPQFHGKWTGVRHLWQHKLKCYAAAFGWEWTRGERPAEFPVM